MIKFKQIIKLVSINILLAFAGSITISELYLKVIRPKFPMEVYGASYLERLNKAKSESIKNKILTVVIGDSFRVRDAHILGTRSNEDIYITPAGTGVISYGGIRFNENEILSLYSNSDIVFIPAGTGSVNVTNLTIDSNI